MVKVIDMYFEVGLPGSGCVSLDLANTHCTHWLHGGSTQQIPCSVLSLRGQTAICCHLNCSTEQFIIMLALCPAMEVDEQTEIESRQSGIPPYQEWKQRSKISLCFQLSRLFGVKTNPRKSVQNLGMILDKNVTLCSVVLQLMFWPFLLYFIFAVFSRICHILYLLYFTVFAITWIVNSYWLVLWRPAALITAIHLHLSLQTLTSLNVFRINWPGL